MKRKYSYKAGDKLIEREYMYIPARYVFSIILIILEVAAVVASVAVLCYYVPYFYLAALATEVVCVVRICSSDDNPEYKVPWLLVVLLLPVAGFMLYFLFYKRTLDRSLVKRLKSQKKYDYAYDDYENLFRLAERYPDGAKVARVLSKISGAKVFDGGKQEYFPLGEAKWDRLLSDLESAQTFIYLEYFIIEEGEFWNSILDVIRRKAAEGVDVRLVYDDFGCMTTLPADYDKQLKRFGIHARPFARLKPSADGEFNNRSHRKIAVIDGKIGYTGGINLADEYVNRIVRFGHWKDTAVRLEGRAVWELTRLFLSDFGFAAPGELPVNYELYPEPLCHGKGFVIPFGDGPRPVYKREAAKSTIMSIITSAKRYVYVTTPYLIIDNDMCTALEHAALGGVDVRIILPHVPDKKLVLEISRSYYPRLMRAGVRIYEYTPGFIHSKVYLSDDGVAMVGTVNMDYRSLVHHFECAALLYGCECIPDIRKDLDATLAASAEITEEDTRVSLPRRMLRAVVRVFSTLL